MDKINEWENEITRHIWELVVTFHSLIGVKSPWNELLIERNQITPSLYKTTISSLRFQLGYLIIGLTKPDNEFNFRNSKSSPAASFLTIPIIIILKLIYLHCMYPISWGISNFTPITFVVMIIIDYILIFIISTSDRLIVQGINVSDYWSWGRWYAFRHFHNFKCVLGLERCLLSLVRTNGLLLDGEVANLIKKDNLIDLKEHNANCIIPSASQLHNPPFDAVSHRFSYFYKYKFLPTFPTFLRIIRKNSLRQESSTRR